MNTDVNFKTNVSGCVKLFLDTLDISGRVVFTALNKMTDLGITDHDNRGFNGNRGNPEEKDKSPH